MTINFKRLHEAAVLPKYAHPGDAGMDLYSIADVTLYPGVPVAVPTGWAMELPPGYEAQIRSRSGMALKHAVAVANSPGTVDSVYRGEIKVILINHGNDTYYVHARDRVAQLVIARHETAICQEAEELAGSVRGSNGFGSTGRS